MAVYIMLHNVVYINYTALSDIPLQYMNSKKHFGFITESSLTLKLPVSPKHHKINVM